MHRAGEIPNPALLPLLRKHGRGSGLTEVQLDRLIHAVEAWWGSVDCDNPYEPLTVDTFHRYSEFSGCDVTSAVKRILASPWVLVSPRVRASGVSPDLPACCPAESPGGPPGGSSGVASVACGDWPDDDVPRSVRHRVRASDERALCGVDGLTHVQRLPEAERVIFLDSSGCHRFEKVRGVGPP